MRSIGLYRFSMTDDVTLGCIRIPKDLDPTGKIIYSLENPWLNNARNVSCIPEGTYECEIYPSEKFGTRYLLHQTGHRFGILIHPGNSVKDTSGCILLGTKVGNDVIYNSRNAVNYFQDLLDEKPFRLYIKNL